MKKTLIALTIAATSSAAMAEQGDIYIDVMGGVNFTQDSPTFNIANLNYNTIRTVDSNKGTSFHLGAGYAITDNIRVGGRYSYHSSDMTVHTTTPGPLWVLESSRYSHTLMAEVAYDFVNESDFTPYIKAGLGVSRKTYSGYLGDSVDGTLRGRRNLPKNSTTDFAWRLGAGVNYRMNKNLSVMAEYQYSDLGSGGRTGSNTIFGTNIYTASDAYRVSEVNVGLRYDF